MPSHNRKKNNQRKVYLIGQPVKHSLSPQMQNAAFKQEGLNVIYEKIELGTQELAKFCQKIKNDNCLGFNITIPHKENITQHLDWVSPQAQTISAVNTVVIQNKKLLGFNTDATGYLLSLKEVLGFETKNKKVIVIGAGGASRGICYALLNAKIKSLCLVNRNLKRAKSLLKSLESTSTVQTSCIELAKLSNAQTIWEADLIINTTSIGLNNTNFDSFPWGKINKKCLISDIVYQPRLTPWLLDAKKQGHPIHTGEGMLAGQGALAFSLWTQKPAPFKFMLDKLNLLLRE